MPLLGYQEGDNFSGRGGGTRVGLGGGGGGLSPPVLTYESPTRNLCFIWFITPRLLIKNDRAVSTDLEGDFLTFKMNHDITEDIAKPIEGKANKNC